MIVGAPSHGVITERQTEVLRMVAEGEPLKRVADRMGVSLWTAKDHVEDLRGRLKARNLPHAVAIAMRLKLIA